jgi:cytosolic carboxypeptidase protein 2/3
VLIFDSRFENGNLRKVAKVSNVEYNLWLENDLHTRGNTQWYYFKVIYRDVALLAEKRTHRIKFNVLNLAKTSSLYQVGMKPVVWSRRRHEEDGVEWFRGGDNITYRQNTINRFDSDGAPPKVIKNPASGFFLLNQNNAGEGVDNYYTFSFTYEFTAHQDDEVTFCHAIPYTYSHM